MLAAVYLYGERVTDAERDDLLARLRERGTPEAASAVTTLVGGHTRSATPESGMDVEKAMLLELVEWADLEGSAPGLVRLRDRLAGPMRGSRII